MPEPKYIDARNGHMAELAAQVLTNQKNSIASTLADRSYLCLLLASLNLVVVVGNCKSAATACAPSIVLYEYQDIVSNSGD